MARVLITGASGLVGSHLVPLFGPEDEVHVTTRPSSSAAFSETVHKHTVDLGGDFDAADLPREMDSIIYLAQSENFRDFPDLARDVFEVNVASLMRMLDYARRSGVQRFVYASSGGVYGASDVSLNELSPVPATGRLGFYLSTKLCGEILVESYASLMDVTVLRLFFAYGRGQRRSMLIPRLLDEIRAGKPIVLVGEDGIRTNPIHAADAAEACKAALGLRGLHKINVAGPEALSLRDICQAMGAFLRVEPRILARDGNEPGNLVADITPMRRLLIDPRRRLAEQLGDLV